MDNYNDEYVCDPESIHLYDAIDYCPYCEKYIHPELLQYYENSVEDYQTDYYVICQCPNSLCHNIFMGKYRVIIDPWQNTFGILYKRIYPIPHNKPNFEPRIKEISPTFIKIYEEAMIAEENHLDNITGLAYRRAFEFLVKDFAIYQNNIENKDDVYKQLLSQVIRIYFNDSMFEPIFKRISWLGNDHSHTYVMHDDYNVDDLKKYITSCARTICTVLEMESIKEISPKKE